MANRYTRKGKEKAGAPAAPLPVDDQFTSLWARAFAALVPHIRLVGYGLAALAVTLLGAWGLLHLRTGAREEATELFGRAVRIYEADLLGADEKPKPDARPDEEPPRFKTAKERADATLAELDKIASKQGRSGVGRQALSFRAGVLFDQQNYAEAEKVWRQVVEGAANDDPIRVLAREGVGLCLESQGKLDAALTVYKEIESAGGGFFRDRAQFDQARALAEKGSKPEAEKLWNELLKRVPQGGFHDEIQGRLAALGG